MSLTTVLEAAKIYFDRRRKKRTPKGQWVHNVYYLPDKRKEFLPCCEKYVKQLEIEPLALYEHQKSIEHVAALYQVATKDLELTIKKLRSKRRTKWQ